MTATDPGTKYADRVKPEFKSAMEAVAFAGAYVLRPHKNVLEQLDEAERLSHAFLHITDPTLYRDQINSAQFSANIRMARAALSFIREVEAVAKDTGVELPEMTEAPS